MATLSSALTAERVATVFKDCLSRLDEDKAASVIVEGISMKVGFHPGRIAEHRREICKMLAELPDDFKSGSGGGASFLNACQDRHGRQWTDFHRTVEQLMLLGLAVNEVMFSLPRRMWEHLPGGMPYFVVK